ncbi:hypothetical protein [Galbibacter pacificus]|uniref:Uncharacterized protein n=1 Tax=Galbibacter pacificus TaxID=2996052 RepID=A0ABT6FRR5_9FLAO|nr:hypothetical protein [Galbibacter pacificus]MDG3582921.1 hypothetical protein [Galbibacter pacificus]MDG3585960.1 hypothetical protein [Galbibacter pacificus]
MTVKFNFLEMTNIHTVHKRFKFFFPIFFFAFGMPVFAQVKKKAAAKELRFALEERYKSDKAYAESRRAAFNRGTWIGLELSDLIATWGPPSRMVSDGADGKIAVYEKASFNSGGTYTPGYVITNGFGNVVEEKKSEDTRWSSSYFETIGVYADNSGIIREIKYDNSYTENKR